MLNPSIIHFKGVKNCIEALSDISIYFVLDPLHEWFYLICRDTLKVIWIPFKKNSSAKNCHSNWENCNTQVINYEKNECQSQLNLTDMNSLFLFRELALIIVIVCRKNTLLYITVFCLFILFSFLCVGMGCLDKEIFDIQMM